MFADQLFTPLMWWQTVALSASQLNCDELRRRAVVWILCFGYPPQYSLEGNVAYIEIRYRNDADVTVNVPL